MTYKRFDIVKVPCPFTDRQASKNRPALILSDHGEFNSRISHSVMTMITSAKHADWSLDTTIHDLFEAGLKAPSKIRLKIFTLDDRLSLGRLGGLGLFDQSVFEKNSHRLLGL